MQESPRHILLTGATGLLGSYLLPALRQAGYRIRALYRHAEEGMASPYPQQSAVEWVPGDLLDPDSLEAALTGVDAVVHAAALVSYRHQDRDQLFLTNETGTANLVNAALYCDVPRFLHVGSVATLERSATEPASEAQFWPQTQPLTSYGQSKFLAQREVWRGQAEGLSVATVFPAVLVGDRGPEAPYPTNATLERLRQFSRRFPRLYPTGANGYVAASDVATAILKLLARNRNGERFVLSAENWSYRELLTAFAEHEGRPAPTQALSPRTLRWIGRIERWRGGAFADLLSPEAIRMASTTFTYDGSRATQELDLAYAAIRPLLR